MMKKTARTIFISLLVVAVLFIGIALSACGESGATSGGVHTTDPKVHSVVLRYNEANIGGTLEADLSLGTVRIVASVTKDEGADGTVTFRSGTPSVAKISSDGLVTLLSAGETVITAQAGGKRQDFVLVVTDEFGEEETFAIAVSGGTSSVTEAAAGDYVTVTPAPDEGKVFVRWEWDDAISAIYGNTFLMPASDVTISAVFTDKLGEIYVHSYPDDSRVVKGGEISTEGLKIMARAAVGDEEWDVTKDCVFSEYTGGDSITATYTLGGVNDSVEIPVTEVTSYFVSAESFKAGAPASGNYYLPAMPDDINTEKYDAYKETGYIAATQSDDTTARFTYQGGSVVGGSKYSVSNIPASSDLAFYFWSDFDANAHIIANIASSNTYKTENATYADGGPNAVHAVTLADAITVYCNNSPDSAVINPEAQAKGFEGPADKSDWGVCGYFNDAWLFDMRVTKGWNSVRLCFEQSGALNVSGLEVRFSGAPLTEFLSDISFDFASAYLMESYTWMGDIMVPKDTRPEDLDAELAGYEDVGAAFLEKSGAESNANAAMKVGNEGGVRSVINMKKDESVYYYIWSEGNGTADIVLNVASSSLYNDNKDAYPVVMNKDYAYYVNGEQFVPADDVISPEQHMETGGWETGQQFNKLTLFRAPIKAGWNVIRVLRTTSYDDAANHPKITLGGLDVRFAFGL